MTEGETAGDAGRRGPAEEGVDFQAFASDASTPGLGKYQDLVIGDRSVWHLVRFEFLTAMLSGVPGIAGLALRRVFYPSLFAGTGGGLVTGVGVSLRQPGRISLGNRCVIDDLACLSVRAGAEGRIVLADNVLVSRGAVLNARDAVIEIGERTTIGAFARIASTKGHVRIGKFGAVAAYCYVGCGGHRMDRTDVPMSLQGSATAGGVTIGDDVWIGTHSVVLDGVSIGKGSVIGAGSLVNKDVPEYSVAYGWPAEVRRRRDGDSN